MMARLIMIFIVQIENILTELVLAAKSEGIHLNVALLIKTVQQVSAIIE
jgi:hypothetical protein